MRDFQYFVEHLMKGNCKEVKNCFKEQYMNKIACDYMKFPIHIACEKGFVDIVKLMLQYKCNIDCEDHLGWTPLHWASKNGHLEIVKLLLYHKCNMECEDKWQKKRPIHYASENGEIKIVKLLLQHNCNIEGEDYEGWRPIHLASENGHLKIVKLLLYNKCDAECEDKRQGKRSIHLASKNGHLEIVKLLLNHKCNMEIEDNLKKTPIHWAIENGHVNIVKLLLQHKCSIECEDYEGWRPIHWASLKGNLEIVKFLLQHNCNIECEDKRKRRPIHWSSINGHLEIVKLLLQHNCNIESDDNLMEWRPVHCASIKGHLEIVKLLLQHNCNFECEDKRKRKPIHLASIKGHFEISKLLLQHNCNIECYDKQGWGPIHLASMNGHLEIVKLLLQRNCYTEYNDKQGLRPIHWATINGHLEIFKLLLSHKCNIECEDNENKRPIHWASLKGNLEIVKFLLQHNCNIECVDKWGWRPIHCASMNGHLKIVKLLSQYNCNMDCEDILGWRPIHCASMNGHLEIVKLLLQEKYQVCEAKVSHESFTNEIINPFAKSIMPLSHRENPLTLSMKFHGTLFTCFIDHLDSNSSNVHDGDDNSLLHMAVGCLNVDLCKSLLNAGAKVNHINNSGNSPLLDLFYKTQIIINDDILNKLIDIINILIEYGADINVKSANGITVFQSASKFGNEKLMLALVSNNPNLSNFCSNDFQTAFTNQWFKYAEMLTKFLPDNFLLSNITNETFQQCKKAEPKLIKLLFDKSSSNLQQSILENFLYDAVNSDNSEIFEHFIKIEILEPKLLTNGETLLTFILKEKKMEFIWQLLDSVNKRKFVNLKNSRNQNPLHIAIEIEEIDIIDNLIHESKEFNSEDIDGKSILTELLVKISNTNNRNFKRRLLLGIKSAILLGGDIYKVTSCALRTIDACTENNVKAEIEKFCSENVKKQNQGKNEADNKRGICNICMDNFVDISYQCGHLSCTVCSDKLFICPFCNRNIIHRKKIFFN